MKTPRDQLVEAGARDEIILANIGEGLIVTDDKGVIVKTNQAFSDMLGFTAAEVYEKKLFDVVPNIDKTGNIVAEKDRFITKTLTEKRKIVSSEISYKRKDGKVFPVAITVSPIIFENEIIGAVEIFRDITREKELERIKDQFISSVSHELRSPMSAVKGLVSMLVRGDYGAVPERFKQPLVNISIAAERQIHLINDLLNLSRLQTGNIKFTLSDFSLAELVTKVVEALVSVAQYKHLELKISDVCKKSVQADDIWTKQILENIIGNAVKFTERGSITISCKEEGEMIIVLVSDTGIGLSLSDQEQLFSRFQLNKSVLNKTVGSGIGLHIAREVARKMGGDVRLERSEVGKGSTFSVILPIAGSELAKKTRLQLEKESALALNNSMGK